MSRFLEDLELANKVNDAIKEAEQRNKDNYIEITKELIKKQYEDLEQENKQLKDKIEKLKDYGAKVGERRNQLYEIIDKAIEYIKEHNVIATNKEYLPKDYEYCCNYELLEILEGKDERQD